MCVLVFVVVLRPGEGLRIELRTLKCQAVTALLSCILGPIKTLKQQNYSQVFAKPSNQVSEFKA